MEIIKQLFQDESDDFVVDFDEIWQPLGLSRKNNAKRKFLNSGFIEGKDYISFLDVKPEVGRHSEKFMLTVDCLKLFCMMTKTEQGRQIRQWYCKIEREVIEARPKPMVRGVIDEITWMYDQQVKAGLIEPIVKPSRVEMTKEEVNQAVDRLSNETMKKLFRELLNEE